MPENIDFLYSIVSQIYSNGKHLMMAVCLSTLCRGFCKNRWAARCVGAAYLLTITVLYYIPLVMSGFTAYAIAAAVTLIVFAIADRSQYRTKLFLIIVCWLVEWIVSYLTVVIGQILSYAAFWLLTRIFDCTQDSAWIIYYVEFIVQCALEMAMFGIALRLLFGRLKNSLLYQIEELELRELFILLIPVLNGMAVRRIIAIYVPFYDEKNGISIFHINLYYELLQAFCCVIILASIISTVSLYQSIRKKRDEENARLVLENQVRDIRAHIAEVERLYTDIRGVKHDIRNHIEVINGLLAQGKAEEVREYADLLSGAVEIFDFSVKTGNPVTDVILQEKMRLAQERGIAFEEDFHYPTDTGINAFDISVILSNALSNAIEAAEEGGFVRVVSFRNKNAYLITVENSYGGRLEINEASGLPKTSKKDKEEHGFGLQNIKSVAAKYYGDVRIELKEEKVKLTVLLQAVV